MDLYLIVSFFSKKLLTLNSSNLIVFLSEINYKIYNF